MDIYQILRVRPNLDKAEIQAKYTRMFDTYQLTATFAEDPEIARIAQLKLDQLIKEGKKANLHADACEARGVDSAQVQISTIRLALNSSKADPSKLRSSNISGKIDALPESAEKHYLRAVVSLRIDSSFRGCQNAVNELQRAVKMDSSNTAYPALLDAISEQLRDYEQRQRDRAAVAERERQEKERQSQQALAAAQRRQFRESACPTLSGLASIGFSLLACCCICQCCQSSCCCG